MRRSTIQAFAAAGVLGAIGVAGYWRRNPSACPYRGGRFALDVPRPIVTRSRLVRILAPAPGERLLEVGPGTGRYALPVAARLQPGGRLDALDVQRAMLRHTRDRARGTAAGEITFTQGDARTLPYRDGAFDGAYLVLVLGEVPDQTAALSELRRVVRPGGRLVVGELVPDPHVVPFERLRERAEAAGFVFADRIGSRLGYLARFEVPSEPDTRRGPRD
jgi:SAM-dependent methyltransferase